MWLHCCCPCDCVVVYFRVVVGNEAQLTDRPADLMEVQEGEELSHSNTVKLRFHRARSIVPID